VQHPARRGRRHARAAGGPRRGRPGGGPAGDLYVEVEEEPHELFTRDGADLHCTVQLPMTAAALGPPSPLPTLSGTEELHVEPGTQAGTVRTLRGKGMPRLRSNGRVDGQGDLMVHVDVVVPTKLDREQTELLRSSPPARRGAARPQRHPQRPRPVLPAARQLPVGDATRCSCSTPFRRPARPCSTARRAARGHGEAAAAGEAVLLGDGCGVVRYGVVAAAGGCRRVTRHRSVVAARAVAAGGGRAGAGQGRPRRAGRRAGHEAGVDAIVPWTAARCVARCRAGDKGLARWQRTAREAAKQAREPWVPPVAVARVHAGAGRAGGGGRLRAGVARGRDDGSPRSSCPPRARSCWPSGPRAGSPTTSWPAHRGRGAGRAAGAGGAAGLHRRGRGPGRARRADGPLGRSLDVSG
jgi:hypothetical protein